MKKIVFLLSVISVFCGLLFFLFPFSETESTSAVLPNLRVFDGDTVAFSAGGIESRIRYLLIDTPELHHPSRPPEEFGEEARSFNIRLLSLGPLRLEYDRERTDRYGRALAYVFVENEGAELFVNEELVREGLALPLIIPPNRKYADRIFRAFEEAREARRGLWKAAEARVFTAPQAWSEAPYLAGSFVTLFMRIERTETSGRRIRLREGKVAVTAYRGPETEQLLSLREGDRIRVIGKLLLSFNGCEIPVASDIQITRAE